MENDFTVREYEERDIPRMAQIWNEVVEAGDAFPQETPLGEKSGGEFFASQSACAVIESETRGILGLYILHPNNVGRCAHICNASYAVDSSARGAHLGERLVIDCMERARKLGFKILQFNAVVDSNIHARHLYERLGFHELGVIPRGFRTASGNYEDIHAYWISLERNPADSPR